MPMLVVDDSEFDLEIARLAGEGVSEKVIDINHGRTLGKKEISDEVRKQIATEAIVGVSVNDIAREYNISKSSISAYKVGATSTSSYNKPDKDLAKSNNNQKKLISDRAESKILDTLELLSLEKIADCKARDIAGIAKDLSAISKNLTPEIGLVNNQQVNIFRPRMKEEDDYEVIEVVSY